MSVRTLRRVGAALIASVLLAMMLFTVLVIARPKAVHAAPAYQDGFIAFGSDCCGRWTVVNPDGSNEHYVDPNVGYPIQGFRYSPDGRSVAMIHLNELWIEQDGSSGARMIAVGVKPGSRFAWSPDGSRVVFEDSGVIESVPADGSSAPAKVFTDTAGCVDSNPQVTARGYIFFTRECGAAKQAPTLAVYRPGDISPSYVAPHSDAIVSPDGSRILWQENGPNSTHVIDIAGVGAVAGKNLHQIAVPLGESAGVGFGPSGDIIVAESGYSYPGPYGTGAYEYWLYETADFPNAPSRLIANGLYGNSNVDYVQWVNGPTNLPARSVADRIGGSDRIDTAVKASQWSFDSIYKPGRHALTAVLARTDAFPDALTGTALAIQAQGPVLLTSSNAVTPEVSTELQRILAPGSTVYLIGGTAALSPAVAEAVQKLGYTAVRLGGTDRYATAVAIATAIAGNSPDAVLLATGTAFPDALTAGVAAGQETGGGVVLLTDGRAMPAVTRSYLNTLRPHAQGRTQAPATALVTPIYAIGGPAAYALDSTFPGRPSVSHLVGVDRFDTAAKVATSALFGGNKPGRYAVAAVATGLNFPDALSGGALIGAQGGPLLLTGARGLTPPELSVLKTGHPSDIAVLGGTAAVSPSVFTDTADATFGPHAWDGFTNRMAPPLP